MPAEINAKRIIKIYKGDTQLWEDLEGQWQDLVWKYSDGTTVTTKYMAIGGYILFDGSISPHGNAYNVVATFPADLTGLALFSYTYALGVGSGSDMGKVGIAVSGNTMTLGISYLSVRTNSIVLTYTK